MFWRKKKVMEPQENPVVLLENSETPVEEKESITACIECKWLRQFNCDLGKVNACFSLGENKFVMAIENITDTSVYCRKFEQK
jgi:hypothetical protein